MNRKYSAEDFEIVVEKLRNAFPDVSLTADIIVGFPGETEEEFEITYNYLKKIKFYKMHIFKYSQRKGTRAERMPNQIDSKLKEERSHKLIEMSNKNQIDFLNNYLGREIEVLFEQEEGGYTKGHTSNYMVVNLEKTNIENKLIKVKIVDRKDFELIGKIM